MIIGLQSPTPHQPVAQSKHAMARTAFPATQRGAANKDQRMTSVTSAAIMNIGHPFCSWLCLRLAATSDRSVLSTRHRPHLESGLYPSWDPT